MFAQRQQTATIVHLTVVTTFSMVGTVTTSLLGMNLLAEAEAAISTHLTYFFITTLITGLLILLAILKSKQLSDAMDVLADDQKTLRTRLSHAGQGVEAQSALAHV
jgi:uncharacterized membrane protein YciS (DUF1049 family)